MALIKCPECGKEVSEKAIACPNCAYPISQENYANSTNSSSNTDINKLYASLEGAGGQLELYGNRVVIKRQGALAKMNYGFFKGDKEILLSHISGIQLKMGTSFTNGYIQFTLSGGNENTQGLYAATKDENTVVFYKRDNDTAEYIKNKIYELKNQ